MNFLPIRLGSILDLRSGTQWDKETLRYETRLRSALLQNLEIGPGDVVGVFHGNSLEFFADLFAVWQVGATAACLNENLTAPELANVCDFLSAKLLLTDLKQAPEIEATVPVVCTRERLDELPGNSEGVNGPASLDQPALILFTSGTTSLPKGVVHTFRSLLARTALNRQRIGDEALRRTLCVLPTHFGHGLIGNCLTPLFAGGELCLYPSIQPHEYGDLAEILSEARISFMSSVPTMWKLSLKLSKEPRVNHLQCVHVGSAPLSADLWQDIIQWTDTECVVNAYGITETANWTAGISAAEMVPEDGLVGRMWGGNAAVIKANGETKDTGEGELLLQSPSLMSGYFNIPVLTDEVLISGWYRTEIMGRSIKTELFVLPVAERARSTEPAPRSSRRSLICYWKGIPWWKKLVHLVLPTRSLANWWEWRSLSQVTRRRNRRIFSIGAVRELNLTTYPKDGFSCLKFLRMTAEKLIGSMYRGFVPAERRNEFRSR